MRWPFGPPHLTLKPFKKTQQKKETPQKTQNNNKEGLGQVRWPFGPPHLTLKPSKKETAPPPKKTQKPQNPNNKKYKNKKHEKYLKRAFQLSGKFFFFFGRCPKFPFFDNLAQKARTQKNTIKMGFQRTFFEKQLPKEAKTRNSSYQFFLPFASFSTAKTANIGCNPYFIVF